MKILYYLGAEASTPTLPISSGFNKNIIELTEYLNTYFPIKSRIISLVPEFEEKIIPVKDTTQFFIPHDYI